VNTSKFLATLFLGAAATTSVTSFGAVVLTINVQDPSHVTFTAVANNSAITADVLVNYDGGITIKNFFTPAQTILLGSPLAISGNLTGRNAGLAYTAAVTFVFPAPTPVTGQDLSIYYNGASGNLQQFSTTAAPFTGSSSANLSTFAAGLPVAGGSGDVYSSFNGSIIGQWNAVPEPSETMGAIGMGLIAFACIRRARATRQ
jgi:hypothetical protein